MHEATRETIQQFWERLRISLVNSAQAAALILERERRELHAFYGAESERENYFLGLLNIVWMQQRGHNSQ